MDFRRLWKGSAAGLLLAAVSVNVSQAQGSIHAIASAAFPTHMAQTTPDPSPDPPGTGAAQSSDSQPTKDDLFAGTEKFARGASDATEVNMDPESLAMVNGSDAKRAHNMILNVVRTYEYDKPGMYRMEDVEEFRRKLSTGDWHCSIHTRDLKSGESTDICNKHRTDGLVESAIITVEPRELTFIHTIRKASSGSSLNTPDKAVLLKGMGSELAELGPALVTVGPVMAASQREIDAESKEARAGLRAHAGKMAQLHTVPPKMDLRALDEQLREAQKQMNLLKVDSRELARELQERVKPLSDSAPTP